MGAVVRGLTNQSGLVETRGTDLSAPIKVVDQGFAIGDDGVVDGVPVAAELLGHLIDCAALAGDVFSDLERGSSSRLHPRMSDPLISLCPAPLRAVPVRTAPPALVPVGCCRLAAEARVDENDFAPAFHLSGHAPDRMPWSPHDRLDVQLGVIIRGVQADDLDLRKADQAPEHSGRIGPEVIGELAQGGIGARWHPHRNERGIPFPPQIRGAGSSRLNPPRQWPA